VDFAGDWQVLHETMLVLKVAFADQPSVADAERMQVTPLAAGVWRVVLRYGFKEHPDLPAAVARVCAEHGLSESADSDTVSYFLSRSLVAARPDSHLVPSLRSGMSLPSKWVFAAMHKNARGAVDFYCIPRASAIELGAQVLI
jgi:KUP system potassium uptake protein